MKFKVLTLFPEAFEYLYDYSIVGRGIKENKFSLDVYNIRDYSTDKHKKVDDYTYGGGPGMLMTPQPLYDSITDLKTEDSKVIYLSPQGKVLTQQKLIELSKENELILLNGHYEGIDERIISTCVDEEISIGDYVLTGGEIPTMVLIDAISRLITDVLSSEDSYQIESHYNGLLEYPQYTRPYEFIGMKVPDVLMSGDHKKIEEYRHYESLKNTFIKRPDLINEDDLSDRDKKLLKDIKNSLKGG